MGLGPAGFHRLGIPYAFEEAQGIGERWRSADLFIIAPGSRCYVEPGRIMIGEN